MRILISVAVLGIVCHPTIGDELSAKPTDSQITKELHGGIVNLDKQLVEIELAILKRVPTLSQLPMIPKASVSAIQGGPQIFNSVPISTWTAVHTAWLQCFQNFPAKNKLDVTGHTLPSPYYQFDDIVLTPRGPEFKRE